MQISETKKLQCINAKSRTVKLGHNRIYPGSAYAFSPVANTNLKARLYREL